MAMIYVRGRPLPFDADAREGIQHDGGALDALPRCGKKTYEKKSMDA